ncbi:uncharacterized protein N7529_009000 [Penicillium soppii]|jgi:hypothetical protein|uniref:uncharacterized protein n=1 Tax=Penicillium soppii TaxID=69789 RepID=UPI0025488BCD|nr:uncharacterized protein N7529_009000 [Penicillium soppii]KAJ5861690.1 hypothetical protein N7529_009000 [Penicillium soppii]
MFPNNDILLLISKYVNNQGDRLRLLLVCRNWYSLLLPKAHETISVDSHQIYFLARSVQQNPKTGAAIRNLLASWNGGAGPGDHYEVDTLRNNLRQTSEPDENLDHWEADLRTGCPDAWLAVFMLSLESVKSINLKFSYSPYFLSMVARIAADKIHSARNQYCNN